MKAKQRRQSYQGLIVGQRDFVSLQEQQEGVAKEMMVGPNPTVEQQMKVTAELNRRLNMSQEKRRELASS